MTDHKKRWSVPPSASLRGSEFLFGSGAASLRSAHHYPEPVVGVAEFGRDAAARGTTRELDVVPPSSASRCAADTVRGALRVHGGRRGVARRIVPIAAPFVNVLAHDEEAVPVGLAMAHGFGTVPPTAGLDGG